MTVVKYHTLQKVKLLMQNSTDLDQEINKYSWWRAVVATSTNLRSKINDPGSAYLYNITSVNLVGFTQL